MIQVNEEKKIYFKIHLIQPNSTHNKTLCTVAVLESVNILVVSRPILYREIIFCCSSLPFAAAKMPLSGQKSISTPCSCRLDSAISLVLVLFP